MFVSKRRNKRGDEAEAQVSEVLLEEVL